MAYDGRAELIGGRIVPLMASGARPTRIAGIACQALDAYAKAAGWGAAYPDGLGCVVPPPVRTRQTLSPDACFVPVAVVDMDFYPSAPLLAVEVRSKYDRGPAMDAEIADKRADYFAAGTAAVWDVDFVAGTVAVHRRADPDNPLVLRRGDVIDGGPELPGFRLAVDDLFA